MNIDTAGATAGSKPPGLGFGRKVGYAAGEYAANLSWQLVKVFLLYFYTDVYGISAAQGGLIYLVSRVWDAVNDPIMGYIIDHTNTRWGRFRPYILFGAVPLGISTVLAFSTPDLGPAGKFAYALVTFLLLCTVYTIVTLPYTSLTAVITTDTNERSSLAGYRMIFAGLGVVTVSVFTQPLVKLFESERAGFQAVVAAYSLAAIAMYYVTFASTAERAEIKREKKYRIRDITAIITKNRPLLLLAATVFFTGISITLRQSAGMYFIKYNLGRQDLFPVYMAVLIAGAIIGVVLSTFLSRRIGKRNASIIAILSSIVGDLGVLFTPYGYVPVIFSFFFIAGLGYGATAQLMWAMAPDTVEYSEWKTGIRAEGITFSAFSFVLKLETAVGGVLAGIILSASGYVPNAVQSAATTRAILYMTALAPIITGVFGIILLSFYTLDKASFEKIVDELRQRKE